MSQAINDAILNKLRKETLLQNINDSIQRNEFGALEHTLLRSPLIDQRILDKSLRSAIFFNDYRSFRLLLERGADILGELKDNDPFFYNVRTNLQNTKFDLFLNYFFSISPIYLLMYEYMENTKIIDYTTYLNLNEIAFDEFRKKTNKFFADSIDDIYNIPEPTLTLFRLFFK